MAKNRNKRKKKKIIPSKRLTPEQYIFQRARSLPIAKVYISNEEALLEDGICTIMVLRQQPSGNYILGMYLLDMCCLGVKKTSWQFDITWDEFVANFLEKNEYTINFSAEISTEYGQGLIKSALEYAAKFGIAPHKNFKLAQYILDDMKTIKKAQYEHPKIPQYNTTYSEYNPLVIATLNKSVGEKKYTVVIRPEFDGNFD